MAELGEASSVAGLLSVAWDVTQLTGKYINAVAGANKAVLDILGVSLMALQSVLVQLHEQIDCVDLKGVVPSRPKPMSQSAIGNF